MIQDHDSSGGGSISVDCSGTWDSQSPSCPNVCHRADDLPQGLLRSSKQENAREVLRKYGLELPDTNMKALRSSIDSVGSSSAVYVEETCHRQHSTPHASFSEQSLVTGKQDVDKSPISEKSTVSVRSASEHAAEASEDPGSYDEEMDAVEPIETGVLVNVWAGPCIAETSQLNDSAQHTKKEVSKLLRVASGIRTTPAHGCAMMRPSSLFCLNLCTASNQDTSSIIDMFSDSTMEKSDCRGWSLRDWMPSIPKSLSKEAANTDATGVNHAAENSGGNIVPCINMPKSCRARAMEMPGGLPPISEDGTCLIEAERDALPLTSARFASPLQVLDPPKQENLHRVCLSMPLFLMPTRFHLTF